MPSGQPDFWTATMPGMPAIGVGQVAWFQSDTDLVAGPGESDLINYVVPDNMELHVCSGVVSCGLPRLQRYDLRQTPAATWRSPTGYSDPDAKWINEENAYDGDTVTYAQSSISTPAWSSYLILQINQINIDKVRFYQRWTATALDEIDIDVYYDGAWHDVYEGTFTTHEWIEKDIPAGASRISKARVRIYSPWVGAFSASLYEFQFNSSGATPQEGIYFDTHAIIPYQPQAPYLVPAGATFAVRVYNDDDAAQNMSVSLAGFLQAKV